MMRLKGTPPKQKPKREVIEFSEDLCEDRIDSKVFDYYADLWGVPIAELYVEVYTYWDSTTLFMKGEREETEEEWQKRVDKWERAWDRYNAWYEENKEEIEEEVEKRKRKQTERLEAEKKRLDRDLRKVIAKMSKV